jgi:ribonuclease HII
MAAKKLAEPKGHRLGIDENGLGPRLGPLVVTAAWAHTDEAGAAQLRKKLPKSLRADLDDSKALVSCHDVSLGEAWARRVVEHTTGQSPNSPEALLSLLCLESEKSLKKACPRSTEAQCWTTTGQEFTATSEQLDRVDAHIATLEKRGIELRGVKSEIVCTGRLNQLKTDGIHRFAADLHCMERLILHFREAAQQPLVATCGKVGGIGKYEPFFGPLAGRLHTALEEGQARSCYYFPTLGELRFVRDADASDPLVMLASLVGKYVRELLMDRIAGFYRLALSEPELSPSGYHDPVTAQFVEQTRALRKKLAIVQDCFERRPAE